MRKFLLRYGALTAMAAAVVMAGCSDNDALAPEFDQSEAIYDLEYNLLKGEETSGFVCTFTSDQEGGEAQCGPHLLFVPDGAFSDAELVDFSVYVQKGQEIIVELNATSQGSTVLNDIGAAGFDIPVELTLNYAKASGKDTTGLTVLWLKPDGTVEPVPTVLNQDNTATGFIDHFSEFALGWP